MKIRDKEFRLSALFALMVYYGVAYWLPNSYLPYIGPVCNKLRVWCAKHIFLHCGKIRTINRGVYFHSGTKITMGDRSGIGAHAEIPNDTQIGADVMISRNVFILKRNHRYDLMDRPIIDQGYKESKPTIIEDDVWIGLSSILTPGRHVQKGTIVAMGSVLTKDFPPYSVVGGNPAKVIKSRKADN